MNKNFYSVLIVLLVLPLFSKVMANTVPLPQLPAMPELQAETALESDTDGRISFNTRSPFDFDVLLNHIDSAPITTGGGRLFLPGKNAVNKKYPAMVILAGSGGIKPEREDQTAILLAEQGYAALVIDYYGARGFTDSSSYRDKTAGVTEFDIVTDAYSALRALQRHPSIDGERIGVMGFSYGGMATRLAMDARVRNSLARDIPGFSLHVDVYGPCFQDFRISKTTGAPLLTLRGAEDASNNLVDCAREEDRLRKGGSSVGAVVYATAGHAWEVNTPRRKNKFPYVNGCIIDYDMQGFPSREGQQIIPPGADIARSARHKLRLQTGKYYQGCLGFGYIVGRDEPVKQRAEKELLDFLHQQWSQ